MSETVKNELRLNIPASVFQDFSVICAFGSIDICDRLNELIVAEVKNAKTNPRDYIPQADLITLLGNEGFAISRQTLHAHRIGGKLPAGMFFESVTESKTNRKVFYHKKIAMKYYKTFFGQK